MSEVFSSSSSKQALLETDFHVYLRRFTAANSCKSFNFLKIHLSLRLRPSRLTY